LPIAPDNISIVSIPTVSVIAAGTHFEESSKMKYVLVTGGVVSGLGKGVTASSIGVLLKNCGLRVTSIKIGGRSRLGGSAAALLGHAA
jgi:hypothetical protein